MHLSKIIRNRLDFITQFQCTTFTKIASMYLGDKQDNHPTGFAVYRPVLLSVSTQDVFHYDKA